MHSPADISKIIVNQNISTPMAAWHYGEAATEFKQHSNNIDIWQWRGTICENISSPFIHKYSNNILVRVYCSRSTELKIHF